MTRAMFSGLIFAVGFLFYFVRLAGHVPCQLRIIVIDLIFMIHRSPPSPRLEQIGIPSFAVRVNWMKIIKGAGKCNLKETRFVNF